MYKYLITALFLITYATSFAQSGSGYLGASIGPSFPRADYFSTEINNDGAGYAKNGLSIGFINAGYMLSDNIGVAGMLFGSAHPVDVDQLFDDYESIGIDAVESDPWSSGSLLLGLLFSVPFSGNDAIYFRPMTGYATSSYGEVIFESGSGWAEIPYTKASSIMINLGIGIHIDLTDRIFLTSNFDYCYTEPEFKYILRGSDGSKLSVSHKQKISTINALFGLAYRFSD